MQIEIKFHKAQLVSLRQEFVSRAIAVFQQMLTLLQGSCITAQNWYFSLCHWVPLPGKDHENPCPS